MQEICASGISKCYKSEFFYHTTSQACRKTPSQRIRQGEKYIGWKNIESYPNLKNLFKKYFSAPPSSVYSERLFSEFGNVYEEKRSRLLPKNSEKLLFLHHNLKEKFLKLSFLKQKLFLQRQILLRKSGRNYSCSGRIPEPENFLFRPEFPAG